MLRPLFVAALAIVFAACSATPAAPTDQAPQSQTQEIFSTEVTLTLYGTVPAGLFDQIFTRLHALEPLLSDYIADSEISRLSLAAGKGPQKLSPETVTVLQSGLAEASLTKGIFDPTIGPVSHLWAISANMASDQPKIPGADQITAARGLVNWHDLVVDAAAGTAELKKPGMVVDVGGVAKGYALDVALKMARDAGVKAGILNMGNSSMAVLGVKPGNKDFRIGLQDPTQPPGSYFAIATGHDFTVESSGIYQKYFMYQGKRYHHIMDPRTGSPAANGVAQVTLFLPIDTKLADGLSTSCLILGVKDGLALIESLPDAAAVFVTEDKKVYVSSRVGNRLEIKDTTFVVQPNP